MQRAPDSSMESLPIIRAFSAPPQPAAAHACEWSAGHGGVCFAHGGSYAWQDGIWRKGLAAHLHPQEGAQGRAGQNSSGRPAKGAVLICTVVTGPFSPSNRSHPSISNNVSLSIRSFMPYVGPRLDVAQGGNRGLQIGSVVIPGSSALGLGALLRGANRR